MTVGCDTVMRGLFIRAQRGDMPRKRRPPTPLALYLQAEAESRGVTLVALQEATGISDSTLGRIFSGEVKEPKAVHLAKIARALGIPFWKVMDRAGYSDDGPADADEEVRRIAAIITDEPELQSIMHKLVGLSPRDIRVIRKYIEVLKSGD